MMKSMGFISGKVLLYDSFFVVSITTSILPDRFWCLGENRIIIVGKVLHIFVDLLLTNRNCFPKITIGTSSNDLEVDFR